LKWRQSPRAVAELQAKQQAILASAARLLKPGGRLVYATCSLLEAENETVTSAFSAGPGAEFEPVSALDALSALKVEAAESIASANIVRLWPHRHQTDGFYAAIWQRR